MSKDTNNFDTKNTEALNSLYQSFIHGLNNHRSERPRKFLQSIGLDYQKLYLGFNSGQFHHNKDNDFKKPFIELGVLVKSDAPVREKGMIGYSTFGDYGVVFPLKDNNGKIVNLYSYRIKISTPKGGYLNNKGVYPAHPSTRTSRLFICDNVIDTATLHQCDIIENRDSVIALNDGELSDDIIDSINGLEDLDCIVFLTALNVDSIVGHVKQVTEASVIVKQLIDGDSLNEMYLKYAENGLEEFINEVEPEKVISGGFNELSNCEFTYQGKEVSYSIYGLIADNPTLLEFDFVIKNEASKTISTRLNLLDEANTKQTLYFETESTDFNCNQIILELGEIREHLERVRIKTLQNKNTKGFSTKQDKHSKNILKSENLFKELDKLIEDSGVIGEDKARLLLFIIACSYKFKYNLHAVIHSPDIGLGSELVTKIARLIPEMEQYNLDITTSRSFRYYGNSAIDSKLLVIPDYTGVTSNNAINDLKRLQAKGVLINDAPTKGKDGILTTRKQEVLGHTSSIGACMNSKKIFEGEPRTVLVKMDTTQEQIQKQMNYDCLIMSGEVDTKNEEKARELLGYIIKNIQSLEVVNPFAKVLMLPTSIRNARMLSLQLHSFVSLVTLFHQHQREIDANGKVISTKEDVQLGVELFLDAIMLQIDDLDAGTRDFFDKLKNVILNEKEGKKSKLSSLDIQRSLMISKSQTNRFLKTLVDYEYIKKEGHKNLGLNYSITNWDELSIVRNLITKKLSDSSDSLGLGH